MRSFDGGEIFAMRDGNSFRRIFLLTIFPTYNKALQEKQCNTALKTIHFFLYFFCLYICNWISKLRSSCTSFCCSYFYKDGIKLFFCKSNKWSHVITLVIFIYLCIQFLKSIFLLIFRK